MTTTDPRPLTPLAPKGSFLREAETDRHRARLDQVMCTLEGMVTLLAETPGDLAVVIHGDRDCLGILQQGMDHPGTERFFGTQLGDAEALGGLGVERLRECLEMVAGDLRPQVVFVLGTCLSALLGEDLEPVCRGAAQETGVRVVTLGGAGMGFVTQAEILDRHACLLIESAPEPGSPGQGPSQSQDQGALGHVGLALVGFHPGQEILCQLETLGVPMHVVLGKGAPLSQWHRLLQAGAHVLLDRALYPRLTGILGGRQGQKTLELPFPVGHGATETFFEGVLGDSDSLQSARAILASASRIAREAVAAARPRLAGLRLGFNLGSKKNLDPRSLARAGLGDLRAFEELGFAPVLLVQGDDAPERLDTLQRYLHHLGCHAPVRVFADTVFFGDLCRAEGCHLVYASDHLREEALAAGVGFLAQGTLAPGFGGVTGNIQRILGALGAVP